MPRRIRQAPLPTFIGAAIIAASLVTAATAFITRHAGSQPTARWPAARRAQRQPLLRPRPPAVTIARTLVTAPARASGAASCRSPHGSDRGTPAPPGTAPHPSSTAPPGGTITTTRAITPGIKDPVAAATLTDGKTLAAASDDAKVWLWNLADPARPARLGQPLTSPADIFDSVAFSPDGRTLATAGDTIRLWDSEAAHHARVAEALSNHLQQLQR